MGIWNPRVIRALFLSRPYIAVARNIDTRWCSSYSRIGKAKLMPSVNKWAALSRCSWFEYSCFRVCLHLVSRAVLNSADDALYAAMVKEMADPFYTAASRSCHFDQQAIAIVTAIAIDEQLLYRTHAFCHSRPGNTVLLACVGSIEFQYVFRQAVSHCQLSRSVSGPGALPGNEGSVTRVGNNPAVRIPNSGVSAQLAAIATLAEPPIG